MQLLIVRLIQAVTLILAVHQQQFLFPIRPGTRFTGTQTVPAFTGRPPMVEQAGVRLLPLIAKQTVSEEESGMTDGLPVILLERISHCNL